MKRLVLGRLLGLAAGIALLAMGLGCGAVNDIQQATAAGDSFMTALRDSDYAGAYAHSAPALQTELGSADKLKTVVEGGNVHPTKWSYSNRTVSGDQAVLDGDVTFTGDRQGTLHLVAQKSGSDWKVAGMNMKTK